MLNCYKRIAFKRLQRKRIIRGAQCFCIENGIISFEKLLDNIGITCNKNTIPFDPASPFVTSGIRLGTPAATTRGFKEEDFKEVASIMGLVLNNPEDTDKHAEAAKRVAALCAKYPLYTNL